MSSELSTKRLQLIALSAAQLGLCLSDPAELETVLGMPIARDIIDANVTRAINMKLAKMAEVDAGLHDWVTYWVIVIKSERIGAGLIGFKGNPDAEGRAEIGYGIAAAYRNQGYVTEALSAICEWAFVHPRCRALTATTVTNPASEKVLRKAGWQKVHQTENSSNWEISR